MATQRVYRTHVSSPTNLTLKGAQQDCEAKVHGHVPKYGVNWVVTSVLPHTCVLTNLLADHPNLSSTLIAQLMYSEIVEKKDMEAKHIQVAVKARFKYGITYGKA